MVKSGAWDGNDIFYFTTLNHLKYLLPNGDSGIIRTLEVPLYLASANNGVLHCLDREGKVVEEGDRYIRAEFVADGGLLGGDSGKAAHVLEHRMPHESPTRTPRQPCMNR